MATHRYQGGHVDLCAASPAALGGRPLVVRTGCHHPLAGGRRRGHQYRRRRADGAPAAAGREGIGRADAMDAHKTISVASAYLALLADRGVDYLFGNAGTDFAPIVEAYAEAEQHGTKVPAPMLAAHENLAVAMAHGYGLVTRKIPAVMVHVSVGTANMVCGAMNAARENVAILLTAGRTPLNEAGPLGARDGYIHWAQEMFDQAGMLRELVKWDYELRNGEQLETVVDRALAIAASEPRGPVYWSLPREVIAAPASNARRSPTRQRAPAPFAPDATAVADGARMIASAKRPLIVTSSAGRDPAAFAALAEFADRFAIPVAQHHPRHLSLPSSHAMNLGYEPTPLLADADLILALEVMFRGSPCMALRQNDARSSKLALIPCSRTSPCAALPAISASP